MHVHLYAIDRVSKLKLNKTKSIFWNFEKGPSVHEDLTRVLDMDFFTEFAAVGYNVSYIADRAHVWESILSNMLTWNLPYKGFDLCGVNDLCCCLFLVLYIIYVFVFVCVCVCFVIYFLCVLHMCCVLFEGLSTELYYVRNLVPHRYHIQTCMQTVTSHTQSVDSKSSRG